MANEPLQVPQYKLEGDPTDSKNPSVRQQLANETMEEVPMDADFDLHDSFPPCWSSSRLPLLLDKILTKGIAQSNLCLLDERT